MASITGAQLSSGLTSHASEFLKPLPESAPQPTISKIDFAASGIPQYANAYAIVIDDLFTRSECAELVNLASKANNSEF